MIQAPNLAHVFINILQTFLDIGPLKILALCPPYWISKWPPFEIYICNYLWSNADIDFPFGVLMYVLWVKQSTGNNTHSIFLYFYQWAAILDFKMAAIRNLHLRLSLNLMLLLTSFWCLSVHVCFFGLEIHWLQSAFHIFTSGPPYWISKWPPLEIYICDYLWM